MRIGLVALTAVLGVFTGTAESLVVEPNGLTLEQAVGRIRSLRRSGALARDAVATIRVAAGRYSCTNTIELTPEDSNLRIVGAAEGGTVFDGSVALGPFSRGPDGIGRTPVPKGLVFDQLWVNGTRAQRARTPNRHFLYMKEKDDTSPSGAFYAFPDDIAGLSRLSKDELSRVLVDYWLSWDMGYARILSIDPDSGLVKVDRQDRYGFFNWDKTHPRYAIENCRAALDAPGEWFLDVRAGELLYVPREGESLADTRACAPVVKTIIRLKGDARNGVRVRNVVLENIGLEYASLEMEGKGIPSAQAAVNVTSAALEVEGADGFSFVRGRIAHTGGHGVWFRKGTVNARIEHSLIEDLGAGGVYFGDGKRDVKRPDLDGANLSLSDSIVRAGGRIMNGAVGVWLGHVHDCRVVHNEICDFFYTGVSFGWVWGYGPTVTRRNHIDFNHIHHIQQGRLSDGGAVYSLGNQEGSTVCNNWIHDVNGYLDNGSPAWGLYTDEGSAGIFLASNLVERCRSGAVHQHYGRENVFRNNIFALFDVAGAWRSRLEDHVTVRLENNVFWWTNAQARAYRIVGGSGHLPDFVVDGNAYWCPTADVRTNKVFNGEGWADWRGKGADAHGAVADPCFVDALHGDWTLRPDSPLPGIGFKPFDWTQAGVNKSDAAWRREAARRTWDDFADAPKAPRYQRRQTLCFDCENAAVGVLRNAMGSLSPLSEAPGRPGGLAIVDRDAAQGKKALKFVEVPGIAHPWEPMADATCRFEDGQVLMDFSVKAEKGAVVQVETRDYDNAAPRPYLVGMTFCLKDEEFSVEGKPVCKVPNGVWADVRVTLRLGGDSAPGWVCRITPRGGASAKVATGGWRDLKFSHLTWVGFMSFGPENSVWYLDDIRIRKDAGKTDGAAAGREVVFRGPDGGAFSNAANWSGGTVPSGSDVAVVPDGRCVVVGADDLAAATNVAAVSLAGRNAAIEFRNAAVDFPADKVRLRGNGQFRAVAEGMRPPRISLRQDSSTFEGSFLFRNVQPVVYGQKALGRNCPVTFHKALATGEDSFVFAASGEYGSDIAIVREKGPFWYAFTTWHALRPVVNRGRVTVKSPAAGSCLRFACESAGGFRQVGTVETDVRIDVNGRVELACPVVFSGRGEAFFSDDASGRLLLGKGFSFNGLTTADAFLEALLKPGVVGKRKSFDVEFGGDDRTGVKAGVYEAAALAECLKDPRKRTLPAAASVGEDGIVRLRFTPETSVGQMRDLVRRTLTFCGDRQVIVSLAEGVYPVAGTIELGRSDSGRPGKPVIWRGEGNGAVFSGGARLAPWEKASSGVWTAPLPREADGSAAWADCLFVGGERRQVATYPTEGFLHATNFAERILAKKGTYRENWDYTVPAEHTVRLSAADFAPLAEVPDAELKFLRVRLHSKWNSALHPVVRIDRKEKSVTFVGPRCPPWNVFVPAECPLRFENFRGGLEASGRWFCDPVAGRIVYRPLSGEDVACAGLVPRDGLETLFRLAGDIDAERWAGNMRFENIVFRHTAPMRGKGPVAVPESLMLADFARAVFVADGARQVTFDRCRWEGIGSYGVWFRDGCMSNAVVNGVFTDLGAGAVRIGKPGGVQSVIGLSEVAATGAVKIAEYVPHSTAFVIVDNNLVEHGGRFHAGAAGIFVGAASDCAITHNEIRDFHYTGISLGYSFGYGGSPAQRNICAFNRIEEIGKGDLSDMAGVYLLGTSFGTCVSNNVIRNVRAMVYGGWGLYTDEGTEGVLFENNLVAGTFDGAVHQHFGRNNVFRNNIFAFAEAGQLAVSWPEPWVSYVMEGNVIVWEKGNVFEKYEGTLSGKANVRWRRNLWWRLDGNDKVFNGDGFAAWQAKGNDRDGLFADPGFVDARAGDFRFRPDAAALKLGFVPFDPTVAGRRR